MRFDQPAGAVGDLDRAPRRRERRVADHARALLAARREVRAQALAIDPAQPHRGVVDQRGLVEGQVGAVVGLHRQRRVRLRHLGQRRLAVQVFVAVPFAGGDPPRGRRPRDVEFGRLVLDLHALQRRLLGQFVAEARPSS